MAQIAYNQAPIPTNLAGGVEMSPENCDKLAQRNLQITYSDNPGPAAAHRIPQTFDARPSRQLATMPGNLLDYPDELVINWGSVPEGSTANIYWPAVDADAVLALANRIYTTHSLSAADGHTVQCTVGKGVTFVPIPQGSGSNFAGLFTIDLPTTVRRGQKFNVVVRRISTHRPTSKPTVTNVPNPRLQSRGVAVRTESVVSKRLTNWRYVTGTFQVTIPVVTAEVMLRPEENTLAIMKWRLGLMSPANRWYPVLERYITYIAGRIDGLGGNANQVPPSPHGYLPVHQPTHVPVHGGGLTMQGDERTGKITGLVYDHFGDFEGFYLELFSGEKRAFKSRFKVIEMLAERAWREEILVSVMVKNNTDEIETIIYRTIPRW